MLETVKSAVLAVAIFALMALAQTSRAGAAAAYGIASLVPPKAYLNMPRSARGKMPALLSQTGAFTDLRTMAPAAGLIPYDLIVPFWSDGAAKIAVHGASEGPADRLHAGWRMDFSGRHGIREDLRAADG